MYVQQGAACTQPNSSTPMSQAEINRQNWRVARVGRRFVAGNVALNDIVQKLGGIGIGPVPGAAVLARAADFRNAPSGNTAILGDGSLYGGRVSIAGAPDYVPPDSGIPVAMGGTVVGSAAAFGDEGLAPGASGSSISTAGLPSGVAAPASSDGSGAGNPGLYGWWDPRRVAPAVACAVPMVLPMMTVFPIPMGGPTSSPAAPGPVASPGGPKPKTPAPSPGPTVTPGGPAPKFPTTGNVCLDLMLNYVLQDQLTQNQVIQCALKGYSGIKNGPALTPSMIAWRNANYSKLPKVADQPNVPDATSAMFKQYGMGALPQTSLSALAWVGIGAVGLWALASAMGKGR
jgi:hypothetical protein